MCKEKNFNYIFDIYNSSPLFNFETNTNCGNKEELIFHEWGGIEEINTEYSNKKIVDKTDIKKINGVYFCYEKKTYKDLLYNGQIIKNGKSCPNAYPKNCGIIDTLLQELFIKNNEYCPLYDIGIDENYNLISSIYNYDSHTKIYYNNNSFRGSKIIGKLILNDGQPCYNSNEKLWKKFYYKEAFKENLKCSINIFGKISDDRYIKEILHIINSMKIISQKN